MFPFVIKKAICGEKLRDYVNSLVLFGRMESGRRLVRVPPEGTGEGLVWTEGRMADQTLAQVIVLSYPPLFGLLGLSFVSCSHPNPLSTEPPHSALVALIQFFLTFCFLDETLLPPS